MAKTFNDVKTKVLAVISAAVLVLCCTVVPTGTMQANAATSAQGQAVLDAVDSGTITIDGKEKTVYTIEVTADDINDYGFKSAVQRVLNDIRYGNIVIEEPEEPTTEPEEPTDPEDPTGDPEDPTGDPEDPTGDPEDPTGDPEDPTGDPEDPTGDPGDPTGDPEDPTGDPEDPTGDPEDPTGDPEDPTGDPEDPTGDPEDPTGDPEDPTGDPEDPTGDPEEPEQPAEPKDYIYRVVIPKGTYECTTWALNLYSNTILDLRAGATIYGDGCTISSGTSQEGPFSGYDGYENLMILGGTVYGLPKGTNMSSHLVDSKASCTIRFGHAKNVYVIGTKVMNNCGGHHIEAGAVKNLLIADCEFTGYADSTEDNSSHSLEAIQLDVIHRDKMNFTGYNEKDDYSIENAVIVNNNFHDLRRGVGSHHAVYGHPYNNIQIIDNTFKNIIDKAIQLEYATNATIKNNTITNATCGISINSAFAGSFYLPNSAAERNKLTVSKTINAKTTVANNTITLNTSNVKSEKWADKTKYAIRVFGDELTSTNNKSGYEPKDGSTLPPNGIYYISGVTVSGNKIGTVNNAKTQYLECAIRARYAKNCTISNNTIDAAANSSTKSGSSGINLIYTNSCTVSGNTVNNALNGLQINNGNADKLENNKVKYSLKNGISILASKTANVNGNTITKAPDNAIAVSNKSTVNNINTNTISGKFTQGISVSGTSSVGTIKKNSITGASKNGISITSSSKVTTAIDTNTINNSTADGILVYDKANVKSVKGNKINTAGKYGILVYQNATVSSMASNTISKGKDYGILVSGKSTCKDFGTNKLSSCGKKNQICISSDSKGIVLNKNTLTVKKGKSSTIKVKFRSYSKKKITWSTSNSKIATVKNGKITAKKKGTCTITVKQNGATSKCKVTVN